MRRQDFICGFAACEKAEIELWSAAAALNSASPSVLAQSPINGLGIHALCKFGDEENRPYVGVVPFDLREVMAITPNAYNAAAFSIRAALAWSATQSLDADQPSQTVMADFARIYMRNAANLAKISPVGAAVCYGVGLRVAQLMQSAGTDRLSIEVLVRNFHLKFSFLGEIEGIHDDCRDPVQLAFVDWMQARPKMRLEKRNAYVQRAFRVTGTETGNFIAAPMGEVESDIDRLLEACAELGVSLPTAQRLLQLYGRSSGSAYNEARQYLRHSQAKKAPAYIPRSRKIGQIIQVCKSLMERALDGPYTTSMLIEAFMWSALAAIRVTGVDNTKGREGFWITWLEKKMQNHLRTLVNYCGADSCGSAKNNSLGARNDAA
jgi:hypothetical protein